jgi:hypothetical protein
MPNFFIIPECEEKDEFTLDRYKKSEFGTRMESGGEEKK